MFAFVLHAAAVLAAAGSSDTGGKDPGESASAWHAGGFLFWMVIVIGALGVLVLLVLLAGRRGSSESEAGEAPAPEREAAAAPQPRKVEHVASTEDWQMVTVTFAHAIDAERAYADVRTGHGDPAWLHDVTFVTRHRGGRASVRGTFAGRYLDLPDLFRDPGHAALKELVRASVPEGGSALIAYAPPPQAETFAAAFARDGMQVHRVSGAEARALLADVADAPPATAPRG